MSRVVVRTKEKLWSLRIIVHASSSNEGSLRTICVRHVRPRVTVNRKSVAAWSEMPHRMIQRVPMPALVHPKERVFNSTRAAVPIRILIGAHDGIGTAPVIGANDGLSAKRSPRCVRHKIDRAVGVLERGRVPIAVGAVVPVCRPIQYRGVHRMVRSSGFLRPVQREVSSDRLRLRGNLMVSVTFLLTATKATACVRSRRSH